MQEKPLDISNIPSNDVAFAAIETAQHIRTVGHIMADMSHELTMRAIKHDASKWGETEWPAFAATTMKLHSLEYGSAEYRENLANIECALVHHYEHNSHHPQHHAAGVAGMSLFDLLEMLADWIAAGDRHATGNIVQSLNVNCDRFAISPELYVVLLRTPVSMGLVVIDVAMGSVRSSENDHTSQHYKGVLVVVDVTANQKSLNTLVPRYMPIDVLPAEARCCPNASVLKYYADMERYVCTACGEHYVVKPNRSFVDVRVGE